eukprot:1572653-Ditylum_brightwellii.AAC.1
MVLPAGIAMKDGTSKTHVLKLEQNLYGQKQAGQVWNQYLTEKLKGIRFEQSNVDECVFYRGQVTFICYVDHGIFLGPNFDAIDQAIADLKEDKLDIKDWGNLKDYLGINISKIREKIKLSQPHIIKQIQHQVGLDPRKKHKSTPAPSMKLLHRDQQAPAFDKQLYYCSVIGKVNYLEKSTHLDIVYAAHQCARFSEDPHSTHAEAVEYLASYLAGTRDLGIMLNPDKEQSFEVYVDAEFIRNWHKGTTAEDPSTAKSRSGGTLGSDPDYATA